LRDGFPLYGGFSGDLSIMQIPPLDLSQFEIIKGSVSTLYGGGAIAGLVNMVSKRPEEDPSLDLLLSQTHVGGSTGNISTASGVKNSVLPFMVQVITIAHIIRTVTVSRISQKPQRYPSILKYSTIPQKDQHYG